MTCKNPEWTEKIVRHQIQEMAKGKSWTESLIELARKAKIRDFNPEHITESQFTEMAKHI